MALSFEAPKAFFLLLLLPAIACVYYAYLKSKKNAAIRFSSLGIVKEAKSAARHRLNIRQHAPFALAAIAILLITAGLAEPMIPIKAAKEGVNVVIVIDDSGSMAANDYPPTRLEAAKKASETLVNSLNPKDNIGIVVFESGATTASYLTPFKDRAIKKLRAIEQKQGQTAMGDGLSLAIDMATSIPNKKKAVILLSDGVNNAGVVNPDEAVQFAKQNKIQVTTIAMGSDKPAVLGYDLFGNPQYAELDEATLRNIASLTGGAYYKSVDKNTLDEIYGNIAKNIEREYENTSIKDWLFGAALGAMLANMYIIYWKYRIAV